MKIKSVSFGITIVLVVLLTGAVSFLLTSRHYHRVMLKQAMPRLTAGWLARHGDSVDSYQSFAIASIIERMREKDE